MRLGCLPYLNVKPLVYAFEHRLADSGAQCDVSEYASPDSTSADMPRSPCPDNTSADVSGHPCPDTIDLVYAPPAELAGMLTRAEIAAAPVSSFACFENPDLAICPGICIAARGPVKSVLVLSKNGPAKIDTLALDSGSLSGASMARIILRESYGCDPQIVRITPEPVSRMLDEADAALVIGNPAMLCNKNGLHVLDVGEEWLKLTVTPAVFAVWAGRGITPSLVTALQEAKRDGLTRLEAIALDESKRLGLSYEVCHDYLANVMVYDLGDEEQRGLDTFRRKATEHGFVGGSRQ